MWKLGRDFFTAHRWKFRLRRCVETAHIGGAGRRGRNRIKLRLRLTKPPRIERLARNALPRGDRGASQFWGSETNAPHFGDRSALTPCSTAAVERQRTHQSQHRTQTYDKDNRNRRGRGTTKTNAKYEGPQPAPNANQERGK